MQPLLALLAVGLAILLQAVAAQDGDSKTAVPPMAPSSSQLSYPVGDIRYCPTHAPLNTDQPIYRMDVLPGGGFDNLRNVDMGQVHYYNYSLCKVSNDGKYLLPDNVFVIPILYSNVETFAEYFDHWDNYTSMTAFSINVGGDFFSTISGKFSTEYQSVKSHQYLEESKTTRVQIRHKLYTVRLQPGCRLHPTFRSRLFEIASNIQTNNTQLVEYLAELLVRDYGTHYTSSVDAGGILAQVDHVHFSSSEDKSTFSSKVTASASANFLNKFSFDSSLNFSTTQSDMNRFISNRTYSQILTYGGPRFEPGFTVSDWSRELPNALVAIDRTGNPLQYVISPQTLPELPEITVRQMSRAIHKAINRYYEINTRQGCTIPGSKNFDFQANVNDNSCASTETNFTFGGIYQTCQMDRSFNGTDELCHSTSDPVLKVNPLTSTTSCPTGYTAIRLNSGQVTRVRPKYECRKSCHHCGFLGFKRCCSCQNVEVSLVSAANYEAFWCAALGEVPPNSGYLFGGYYTSAQSNPFTGTMSCPQYFLPIHFGEDIRICVSSDYELGSPRAIPFAGFQSCHVGNPLAAPRADRNDSSKWPKACPQTYTQHLVTIDNGCEINFCITAGSFNQLSLIPAHRPPFTKYPDYKANISDTIAVVGVYGQVWYRGENGEWVRDTEDVIDGDALFQSLNGNASDTAAVNGNNNDDDKDIFSDVGIATISVGSTLILCTLVAVVVMTGRCWCKRSKKKRHGGGGGESSYTPFQDNETVLNN